MALRPEPGRFTPVPLTPIEAKEFARRRRGRNIAMLVVLVAIAALFYAIAIVKLAKPDLAP